MRNDSVKIQGGTPPRFHSGGGEMNATPPEAALAPNTPPPKFLFNKQASKLYQDYK